MFKKILITDDEKESLEMLAAALEKKGFEIITALDGRKACQKIKEENPDLVILDLVMPQFGGWDVLVWMRKEFKTDTPVIILSALAQMSDFKKSYDLEADLYVTKPVNIKELIKAISALDLIKKTRPQDEN